MQLIANIKMEVTHLEGTGEWTKIPSTPRSPLIQRVRLDIWSALRRWVLKRIPVLVPLVSTP